MRYFLVTFVAGMGFGNITFENETFPNQFKLMSDLKHGTNSNNVSIINIFEFKNKTDYISFTETSDIIKSEIIKP